MLKMAWRFIRYDKPKALGAFFGILVSVFLIGQQVGISSFLTNAIKALVMVSDVPIWVIDNKTSDVNQLGLLDVRVQREVESFAGVKKAYPLVVSGASASFPDSKSTSVFLVGVDAVSFKGAPQTFARGSTQDLLTGGAVTVDVYDAAILNNAQLGTAFEIGGKKVQVAAETNGVRGFTGAYLFTTIERARVLGNIPPSKLSAVLVDVEPDADVQAVCDAINRSTFGVRAWRSEDLAAATVKTVLETSGIGASTGTLIVFAVLTGFVVIGLTLYSSAVDRLRDYGTLKAIGAQNATIRSLILVQAVMISVAGFVVSYALLEGFRAGLATAGVLFSYDTVTRLGLLGTTLAIAALGALFAMRRISKVEPASVFRG